MVSVMRNANTFPRPGQNVPGAGAGILTIVKAPLAYSFLMSDVSPYHMNK